MYISNHNNIVAGDDDVALLPAGEAVRLTVNGKTLYVLGSTTLEVHAQNFSDSPFAWNEAGEGGGSDVSVVSLSVDENGTYTPPSGYDGYSSFTVAVSDVKPKVKLKAGTTYEQAQALACPLEDEIIQIDGIYYIQKL